ncbi:MAG TPA: AAA family ATPase, partial [Vicinamibacterales bacterium]|nr:AAA family ATPase [Vicinamibacterales bacterium]
MRATWLAIRRHLARRPRAWIASGLIAAALIGILAVYLVGTGNRPLPHLQRPTTSERWTMPELVSQIEAGEVLTVTLGVADGGGQMLLAQNLERQYVAIAVTGSLGDAAVALVNLGYRDLLTSNALAAAETRLPSAGDPMRTLYTLVVVVSLVALGVWLLMKMRSRLPIIGARARRFGTIMPSPLRPAERENLTATPLTAAPAGSSGAVHLGDVAGCEEAKLELAEAIDFLRDPARFRALGAQVPRGILLYGPPGTGKTMLARAVATEAGVPFHHASGSDFVEKYVGMGARRVRELFAQARRLGKGVIFIDEFDALGKARGGANSHEEREQTLNQLLVELDGFGTSEDIVVIAATNRLDILDDALLRPGRFSRKIHVGLPDHEGRQDIVKYYLTKVRHEPINIEKLARMTKGYSPAMLKNIVNEALLFALQDGRDALRWDDLWQAKL